ncbi:hypothetical protein SAMN04488066_11486 [Halorubrum aquaticum]|uniref:Uncharacterized protein n=1 Tax=Halorubrum aquaticum TaxID=387340 RepID=A0A1I3BS17_9EURY|nr:hypothetical protein [Halorubrum aquaticum]SFH64561.1 hypothetical protein SAMN04488066_11486 [Halorubrum aquaticum]
MNAIRTALLGALAAVVLIGTGVAAGGVAAAGPNAPADVGPDANASDDAGPPSDLPEPVPEFVGDLLNEVDGFLSGEVENLGDAVSDLAGNDVGGTGGV